MIEGFIDSLRNWNRSTNERNKLQGSYLVAGVVLLFTAGLVSLMNNSAGQQMLQGVLVVFGVMIVNAISWALLDSFILRRIGKTKVKK